MLPPPLFSVWSLRDVAVSRENLEHMQIWGTLAYLYKCTREVEVHRGRYGFKIQGNYKSMACPSTSC